ncbi:OmpA family protein [Kaarinaea lacus]
MSDHTNSRIFHKSSTISVLATSLTIAVVLGGCVSSSSYKEVSKERDELAKKQLAMESNTKFLRNTIESTEAKTARLQAELESVQSELIETTQTLDARNNALKNATQMLDEKNSQLDMTSRQLAGRQAELQATESKLAESNKRLAAATDYMEKTNKLYDELVDQLSSELKANQIKIKEIKDGISVNLSQDILFPSGSAILNDTGVSVIKKVSGNLKNIPHQIIVAGFTDNVPIKGDLAKMFPTNWELAGARAASVVRLLESEGVDREKLTAVSYGENHPVASNDNWEQRKLNRRIEIRLRPVE